MESRPDRKLLNRRHIGLGAALTAAVFVFFSVVLRPFTFAPEPWIAQLQASFTALPITGIFWLAYHMFMVVLIDQRQRKREDGPGDEN